MTESTTQRTCRYPGCERPAEPGEPGVGRPPEYCDHPDHNRASAWRARQRRDTGTAAIEQTRPVDAARQRASVITAQVTGMADHLVNQLHELLSELRTVADPDAAEAQLEAAASDAAEQIAAANGRAVRAEQALRQAVADAAEADAAATEATTRAQELAAELSQTRADLELARQARTELQADLEALTADLAQTRADLRLAQQQTTHADNARAQAEQRAEAAHQHAQFEAARAEAADAANMQARDQLDQLRRQLEDSQERLTQLRETLAATTAERDAARADTDRERAHADQRVNDLQQTYIRQLADLRSTVPQSQAPSTARRRQSKSASDKPVPGR